MDRTLLARYGAVSLETVRAMTEHLLYQLEADCVVCVSGIAGPSGGSQEKPVGTVAVGIAVPGEEPSYGYLAAPKERASCIDYTCNMTYFYLWRWLKYQIPPKFHDLPIT